MQKHCIKIIHKNIQPALCILNAIIIYHTCVHIEYNSIRHMEQQIIVFRVFEINSNIIRALCNNDALRKLSRHKSYLRNVKVQRNKKRGGKNVNEMWRDMIPLRTWLGLLTCVRASILCFNCSSISGNLAYWANFCSASSSFSCIAAIFSSWSLNNIYYINKIILYNMINTILK